MRRIATVVVLGLWVAAAQGQSVDTFPKIIFLDPYSAFPGYPSDLKDSAFAQLESLQITHIVGLGDPVLTNTKFKIIANNYGDYEVEVSDSFPRTLEKFTQYSHWVDLEAENDSLKYGYSFADPLAKRLSQRLRMCLHFPDF